MKKAMMVFLIGFVAGFGFKYSFDNWFDGKYQLMKEVDADAENYARIQRIVAAKRQLKQGNTTVNANVFHSLIEKTNLINNPSPNLIANRTVSNNRIIARNTALFYGLDPDLAYSVISSESNWNPTARSIVRNQPGAIGLMQMMPATGLNFCGLTEEQLWEPALNIECGVRYFTKWLREFGSVDLAICAYHAGPGKVIELGRCPNFNSTQAYKKAIRSKWGEL